MHPKLVQQAMNGNAKATEQLFTETYAKTYALAFRLLRNAQDAEDLVQEAYISAFVNLEHIHDPSKFDVWMKQIVSNRCKDLFKKNGLVDENGEAKAPTTWEEVREYAKICTNLEAKEYGIALPLKWGGYASWDLLMPFFSLVLS